MNASTPEAFELPSGFEGPWVIFSDAETCTLTIMPAGRPGEIATVQFPTLPDAEKAAKMNAIAELIRQIPEMIAEITSMKLALSFAGSKACENAIGVMGQLEIERLSALNGKLRDALTEIRDHWATDYDHPNCNEPMYQGPYGTGVVDGHRAAANIARVALGEGETADA